MGLRYSAALATAVVASCAFDWDSYDPRLGGEGGAGALSSAASGGGTGGTSSSSSSGGAGGAVNPGDVLCHVYIGGWGRDVKGYADGGFVVVGNFNGTIDLGGGPLVSAGEDDGLVARFGPNCEHVFSARTGGPEMYEGLESVAVLPDGGVVIIGDFKLTADLGGMTATSNGPGDSFAARLDPMGNFDWVELLGGPGGEWGRAVTADANGDIYIAMVFYDTIDVGGGPFTPVGMGDVLVAKLDGAGVHQWSTSYGSAGEERARIAADAQGQVFIAGSHEADMPLGANTLPHVGERDMYALALDSVGELAWSRGFSSPETTAWEYAQSVALQPNGNIIVVGRFDTTLDFGTTTLTSAGGRDIFLAALDGAGNPLWAKALGGPGDGDRACGLAVDATGRIAIAGSFVDTADVGGGPLGTGSDHHLFVAVYDSDGVYEWARAFATPGGRYSRGQGVAFVDGGVVLSGYSSAPVDLGDGSPPPFGTGFVLKLAD